MREIPILFSGPMVRAILDGRKTQTRRLQGLRRINAYPNNWVQAVQLNDGTWSFWGPLRVDERWVRTMAYPQGGGWKCPYEVGDRLWVRETWAKPYVNIPPVYRADYKGAGILKWRPSIHMPKWACRLWLTVTGVRVERLQEITDEDTIAEGMDKKLRPGYGFRYAFGSAWDAMYAKPEYQWQSNPWVWCITFSREDCLAKEKP